MFSRARAVRLVLAGTSVVATIRNDDFEIVEAHINRAGHDL